MNNPEQLAQKGIDYLEEAILDVLFEAKQNERDPFVRLRDMRKILGIYNQWRNDNWLIRSLLYKLEYKDEKIKQKVEGGPWKLTDAEYNRRSMQQEGPNISPSGGEEPESSSAELINGIEVSPSKGS